MHLYWVTTEDHHEDWFVVAKTPIAAQIFFEQYEGYDDGDAIATAVCPLELPQRKAEWANHALLESLGAKTQVYDSTRVVHLLGNTYSEGMLEGIIRQCDAQTRKPSNY